MIHSSKSLLSSSGFLPPISSETCQKTSHRYRNTCAKFGTEGMGTTFIVFIKNVVQWVCYVSSQRYQKLWKQGLDSPIFNASRPNFDVRQLCGIARPRKFLLHPAKALLHRVKALAFGVQHFKFIPFPNPHCHYVIHRLSTKHWISYSSVPTT